MANDSSKSSFPAGRRWLLWFNTISGVIAIFALVVMANYLASGHFWRFQTSDRGQAGLSPQTTNLLNRITNKIEVTIFFDQQGNEEIYALTTALLKQYSYANPNITVQSLDYKRSSPGKVATLLSKYKLTNLKDKNFVLFDSGGRSQIVYGNKLYDFDLNAILAGKANTIRRSAFFGEVLFSAAIFNVTYPHPARAYFIYGQGEHDPENASGDLGYARFAAILKDEANVDWARLSLSGTNDIPEDCQLLIVAGPSKASFLETELAKIETYLKQGRCLLVLLNNTAMGQPSGIEKVLSQWNIGVANYTLEDRQWSPTGGDLIPAQVNGEHPIFKSLVAAQLEIYLILPRTVFPLKATAADAPQAEVLAATSTNAIGRATILKPNGVAEKTNLPATFPLITAVDYGSIKNVTTQRGVTRILAIGDSLCFDNQNIETKANHNFANSAINWLVDRPQLFLADIGAQPIREYKLMLTPAQTRKLQWILLGAMPGSVLFLGGLVWLRRRS
ncbi:MAG: Gldg family protein [Verrucomicrobiota bacterium]